MFSGRNSRSGLNKILIVLLILIILFGSLAAYFILLPKQHSTYQEDLCGPPTTIHTPYVTEYDVINQNSEPNGIAVDSSGNVWFIVQNTTELGVLYSSNSTIRTFPIPTSPKNGSFLSYSVVSDSARHLVWFGDDSGLSPQGVWSFNTLSYNFTFYKFQDTFPFQLVLDKAGNLWFSEFAKNQIGEITTNGTELQYPLPTTIIEPNSGPAGLSIDNNGTVWFTDPDVNVIGSLKTNGSNYSFSIYNMTGKASLPSAIAVDSSGNVWLTEHGPSLIAEFNPKTGYFRSISTHIPPVLESSLPYFIYIDLHGNIWFNEHQGNAIARFSPANNSLVEYLIPTQIMVECNISGSLTMTLSPNGTPWFVELFAGKIGTVNLQAPINVGISIDNSTNNAYVLSKDKSLNLGLNVRTNESTALTVYLSTFNFNRTLGLSYSFSPSSGTKDFTSELSITDQGMTDGSYYLTISAETSDIIVSKVIQVNVTG